MAIRVKLKNSVVANKAPLPTDLDIGEVAINANAASPAAYIKNSAGAVVKLAGAGSISTPDATAAAKGIVQLADAAAVTAGTAGLVVDAAQLKAVSDADDWTRTGTEISPKVAGDSVFTSGAVKVGGTTAAPGVTIGAGTTAPANGIYSPGADQVAISTNGTPRVNFGTSEVVFNDGGENYDFRIESDTNANIFFVDASANAVGIGTAAPSQLLHLQQSTGGEYLRFTANGAVADGDATITMAALNGGTAYHNFLYQANSHQFQILGSERARIDSSGRLLVGTSTDSGGALLQVNGNRIRIATTKTPASATAAGVAGEICWDANYIYVCTATNTWKRSAIATW